MSEDKNLRQKYEHALTQFVERVKQDTNILAVFVYGSYANGKLWKGSDIDVFLVTNDVRTSGKFLNLKENDISIQVFVYSRAEFRRRQQIFIHGSHLHHMLASSKLVYSTDKAISEFNRDMVKIAERDKELQLMMNTEFLLGNVQKAQKTLYVEKDTTKCFMWIIVVTQILARILLLMNDRIPGRDVLAEVQELNSEIINEIITNTFQQGYNEKNLHSTIQLVEKFLIENKNQFYKPLFNFISETGDARSSTEIDEHFEKLLGRYDFFTMVESYGWLTQQGDLMPAVAPKRITSKSRITVDEATYFYVGGDMV